MVLEKNEKQISIVMKRLKEKYAIILILKVDHESMTRT